MLPLLLMLLSDPLMSAAPETALRFDIQPPVVGESRAARCVGGMQRIEGSAGPSDLFRNDLSHAPTDEVRRYLLVERTVRGCSAPISYALPGRQGGFIRELGGEQPFVPAPRRSQPPRSSE
ncbi:MAG: hypothetical protein ACK4VY_00220 [Brevundimonas sp.]